MDKVDWLARMRWLRLVLLWQACPERLWWHLRRTNLLARVLPVGGLLSMTEWEVWHLLRVYGCLSGVGLMMGVAWLWSLCVNVIKRRMQRLSILLMLQLLLLMMLLLILMRGLCSAIAPWLQNGQQGTTLVRLRHLVGLKPLHSRLDLEKTLELLRRRFESVGRLARHVLLHHRLRLDIKFLFRDSLVNGKLGMETSMWRVCRTFGILPLLCKNPFLERDKERRHHIELVGIGVVRVGVVRIVSCALLAEGR